MTQTCEAIVLSVTKTSDNVSVAGLYTQTGGREQFIVYGNKLKALLTPMAWVEITADRKPSRNIATLTHASLYYIPQQTGIRVDKQCVALFMAEALSKTLRHPMADEALFLFLTQMVQELDQTDMPQQTASLFMTGLSEHLGYGGEPLEELKEMKSLDVIRTIFG